jgi:hypothetical protein
VATHAFIDGRLVVNAVNLSTHNTGFTLPVEFDELDDSAMGDVGRSRIAGVQDSNLSASWNQDFAAAAVDATLWAALGTVVVVNARPTSAAISATNPEYVGSYLLSKYSPFGAKFGDLATVETQWPLSDSTGIARNTA